MHRVLLLTLLALHLVLASTPGARRVRVPDTDRVIVALQQRNVEKLEAILMDVSDPSSDHYRHFLSLSELTELTGATDETIARTSAWLRAIGATRVTVQNGRDFIRAEFEEQIPQSVLSIPGYLSAHVTTVIPIGRETGPKQRRPLSPRLSSKLASAPTMTPSVQRNLYQVPSSLSGSNATNSQMVWGTGTYGINLSDMKLFYNKFGITEDMSLVHPMGFPGNRNGDNFGEGTLDAQYITAMGPGITTFVYNSNNSASTEFGLGFGPAMVDFITALANNNTPPYVVSISLGSLSWSSCNVMCTEAMAVNKTLTYDECLDYAASNFQVCMFDGQVEMSTVNTEFIKLGLRGVSIVAATGDGGTHFSFGPFPERDPLGALLNKISCANTMPTFPSASGYITGVGGLLLPSNNAKPVVCDSSLGCMVTGGGAFSWYFPVPSYQQQVVQAYAQFANKNLSFAYNASNRAYPDIVTNANNAPIVINGETQLTGGTSAAAPEFAGMISLINDALLNANQPPLGFLNPALYALAKAAPGVAFYDITVGSTRCGSSNCPCSEGFAASAGWDAASGLGMPLFPGLMSHLGPQQLLRKALRTQ